MNAPRAVTAVVAALTAIGLVGLLASGCSKKETAPPPVIKVQPAPPAPPQAQAPAAPQRPRQVAGGAPPDHQVGESVLHAPGDYLETVVITAPHYAKNTVSAIYVENEIKQFHALKGRWPKSLDELGEWAGEPVQKAPPGMKYDYDPSTGVVKVVPAE